MRPTHIKRSLEPVQKKAASEFPAVVLTRPRQSGKTALFQHLFGKSYQYISLELPDVRVSAIEDPLSFLALYPSPVIFDEVKYAPDLPPWFSLS
jgi:predicted AAA+ superfamily ATPase